MVAKFLRGWALAWVLATAFALACRAPTATQPDVRMALSVAPDPPTLAPADVTVRLTDPHGRPVDGADVRLEGDMRMGGMQPVLARTQPTGGGQYVAHDVNFGMAGDWVVIVAASLPSSGYSQARASGDRAGPDLVVGYHQAPRT